MSDKVIQSYEKALGKGKVSLFFANLPHDASPQFLVFLLRDFGIVYHPRIIRGKKPWSYARVYGFAEMKPEDADNAMRHYSHVDLTFKGQPVYIAYAQGRVSKRSRAVEHWKKMRRLHEWLEPAEE